MELTNKRTAVSSNLPGHVSEARHEDREDGAEAGEHLQRVVYPDQSVVACIGRQFVLLHHKCAASRDGYAVACARLAEQAELWVVLFAACSGLYAADVEISL